jgi:hypothetical protein
LYFSILPNPNGYFKPAVDAGAFGFHSRSDEVERHCALIALGVHRPPQGQMWS